MLKKIWNKLKNNITVFITLATAILTVSYAILNFLIYTYWYGYFHRLNIDTELIALNFDGTIMKVVLGTIIIGISIYFAVLTDKFMAGISKKFNNSKGDITNKVLKVIVIMLLDFSVSVLFLVIGNIPLITSILLLSQSQYILLNFILLEVVLYIIEMFYIILFRVDSWIDREKNKDLSIKLLVTSVMSLLLIALVLICIFWCGYQRPMGEKRFRVVDDNYVITYSSGENYVLHKVKIIDDKIMIYKNYQKVINKEGVEYFIYTVEDVEIKEIFEK